MDGYVATDGHDEGEPGVLTLRCRLFGHRWVWYTVYWSTGETSEEDRCGRCGTHLGAVAG